MASSAEVASADATERFNIEPNDSSRLASLCGPVDQNLKHLERRLGVHIRNRGNEFQVSGSSTSVQAASALLQQLYLETKDGKSIEPDFVHLYLSEAGVDELLQKKNVHKETKPADAGVVRTHKKSIKPRGGNQTKYVAAIRGHDINFGIGPAGTGKT